MSKDLKAVKERYLQDPLPVRLGNLASNLARIRSFASRPEMSEATVKVMAESRNFIAWTIGDADYKLRVELALLQLQLTEWQAEWAFTPDPARRRQVAEEADEWSKKILEHLGLWNP